MVRDFSWNGLSCQEHGLFTRPDINKLDFKEPDVKELVLSVRDNVWYEAILFQ